jgi:hypothetical protein
MRPKDKERSILYQIVGKILLALVIQQAGHINGWKMGGSVGQFPPHQKIKTSQAKKLTLLPSPSFGGLIFKLIKVGLVLS